MPELRRDPIIGHWVIVQTERVRRPADFHRPAGPAQPGPCAFCAGEEHQTPPELLAFRSGEDPERNGADWRVRVVPSRFPALRVEGDLGRRGHGLYDVTNGIGAHEVVIESPAHDATLASLPLPALEEVIAAWRERILDLRRDARFRSVLMVRSHRTASDGARTHPHSVILATPMLPLAVSEELTQARAYFDYRERCPFCDVLYQELADGARVVAASDHVVAFTPFAGRLPFEVWILPRQHAATFERSSEAVRHDVARVLRTVARKLERTLADPPFTLVLHTAPAGETDSPYYHWHLELRPAVGPASGTVDQAGFNVNVMPPEDAARYLRDVAD